MLSYQKSWDIILQCIWKEKFTRFGKEIIYLEFEYPWQEGMNRLFVYQS